MDRDLGPDLQDLIEREQLGEGFAHKLATIHRPLARRIAAVQADRKRPVLIGICGPQGSGKSTSVAALQILLGEAGLKAAIVSLDDFYLPRTDRLTLAEAVHPLLATRGPPGTHDIALMEELMARLLSGAPSAWPRFNKATDDRAPQEQWNAFGAAADVILFEGWFVGGRAQRPSALFSPVNRLEAEEDPEGVWRTFVNTALDAYQPLFSRIDLLIQFRAPDFASIVRWRCEQEGKLRRSTATPGARVLSERAIEKFIEHYERLTRHTLEEMPSRADLVVELGPARELAFWSERSE